MASANALQSPGRPETVDQLGKYRLIALLAHGGMGDVYLAVSQGPVGFSKLLAVKELRRGAVEDELSIAMFMDEARLAAGLNHPNIVQTLEVGEEGSRRFIAMEYLEGQSLSRVLHRARRYGTPMAVPMHLRILADVLTALEYAHSLSEFDGTPVGVVHRDVSPPNVFITYEGQVKLIDFGVAKTAAASQKTSSGVLKGKIRYMAPEQTTCQTLDRRADVFAAGLMLWEAAAGRGPWEGAQDIAVLRSLMSGAVPRLRNVRPDLDADLAAIVDRATSPEPAARYPSALAMRDDLERYMTTHAIKVGNARDLSSFVSDLFADDRQALRALVDSQLRVVTSQSALEVLSVSGMRYRDSIAPNSAPPSDSLSEPSPFPSSRVPAAELEKTSAPPLTVLAQSPRPYSLVMIAGGAVLLAAVLALVLPRTPGKSLTAQSALREKAGPIVQTPSHAASVAAPLPPAQPRDETPPERPRDEPQAAHISLRATPAWAAIYVDDVAVANPYVSIRAPDGTDHRVRAEAPGFETRTTTLSFGRDADLAISLDRQALHRNDRQQPPASPGARPAPRPAWSADPNLSIQTPQPSRSGAPEGSPFPRPRHEVDRVNPYLQ